MKRLRARTALAVLSAAVGLTLPAGSVGSATPLLPSPFSWRMEDRFGSQTEAFPGPDGQAVQIPVVTPSQEYVHSPRRTVQFDACAADPTQTATYGWRIDSGSRAVAGCRYAHEFSTLGPHEVEVTTTGPSGQSTSVMQTIDLKDYLIVSLGDSYASGEGNPEVPGTYTIAFPPCRQGGTLQLTTPCVKDVRQSAAWTGEACHRSSWAGPAQAALAFERADPHTTVTFVSLACSGATIEEGLLGRQVNRPPDRPPQVEALADLLCPPPRSCPDPSTQRRVDALVISIGGNDIGFSDIVKVCVRLVGPCAGDHIPEDSPVAQARPKLRTLGLLYVQLFRAINARLTVATVFLTENADAWIGAQGRYCSIGGFPLWAEIQRDDVRWLHQNLMDPLNATARTIARTLGWIYVDGVADSFHGHGYCAADRWIVRYPESWARQGDDRGTLHPNRQGHRLYAQRIGEVLRGTLGQPAASGPPP